MRKAYKDIIEKSQLIQINKHSFVCEHGKFILFIHGTDEQRIFELFFNGIKINTEYTYHEKFEYQSVILDDYVNIPNKEYLKNKTIKKAIKELNNSDEIMSLTLVFTDDTKLIITCSCDDPFIISELKIKED